MSAHSKIRNPQHNLDKAFETMLFNYRYAQGIKFFERFFHSHPFLKSVPKNLTHLGLLYDHAAMIDSKKRTFFYNQARHNYLRALELDPKFYSAWWGLGRIFWHQNDRRSLPYAKKAYRLANKEKDDTVGQFAQNIALIYKGLGNNVRAEHWFKRGLKESPQEWGMYYNLMRFYLDTKPNEKEAEKLARKLKLILETKVRDNRWLKEVYAFTKKIVK